MNNDTEKADELLRREIEATNRTLGHLFSETRQDQKTIRRWEIHLALLETIQKDREALNATLEQMLSHAGWRQNFDESGKELPMTRPPGAAEAEKLATEALASSNETLLKTLS